MKEESLLLLSDLQKLINQVVLIDYTIIILGGKFIMRINVMKKGDSILNVTDNMVVVKRRNGEVDVIPFYKSGKVWRVDQENTVTIGYGNNTVEEVVAEGNVTVTTF